MKKLIFGKYLIDPKIFWSQFLVLGFFIFLGFLSSLYMEHEGHYITGMNNQIVWGMPHMFAVLLIVIASGVLNIASLSSAFNKVPYKPLAPLSALLALAFLVAGLIILVLDLGRPNRLIVAMTTFNFKSIFAWNIFLYSGFALVLIIYMWTMLDREVNNFSKSVGTFAFAWRIILTTGTGSIFGFLVAREAYATAILAPLFIVMSLSYGTAVYYLTLRGINIKFKTYMSDELIGNFRSLTIIFLFAHLYFLFLYHITNLYIAKHIDYEIFILFGGGFYTFIFWVGQVFVGIILPLIIILSNKLSIKFSMKLSSILILIGSFAAMYVIIIGGQAYPLTIFPDHIIIESSFYDNVIHNYIPSIYEFILGLGGIALALIIVLIGITNFYILPTSVISKDTGNSDNIDKQT
tara:strand:- start:380 stop:1600 length:1221 start_codon:yes stop_codon:yes gene_type:complete